MEVRVCMIIIFKFVKIYALNYNYLTHMSDFSFHGMISFFGNALLDALEDSVENQRHRAHQRRVQYTAVSLRSLQQIFGDF